MNKNIPPTFYDCTDTVCMNINRKDFRNYLIEASSSDDRLLRNLLYPMMKVTEFEIETEVMTADGFKIEPVRIYSEMFKRCDVKRYRRREFCQIDRFALAEGRDDETFSSRVARTVGAVGELNVCMQIVDMLADFHGETIFNVDPEKFWTAWFEMSFAWLRLICHQLWVGRYRESLAFDAIRKGLPEGFNVVKSSYLEDTRGRYDLTVLHNGVGVLGISVKSFRYFYKTSSAYRDSGRVEELLSHRGVSFPVVEVRVDERLPISSVEGEVLGAVLNALDPLR